MLKLLTAFILSVLLAGVSQAATYYVATTGSDSNSGSEAAPFRTIPKAASLVNPGDTVIVGDGVYSATVSINRGGTSGNWVTFKSQNKWGAKIQGAVIYGINVGASYVRVEGFDISGQSSTYGAAGINVGSNVQIVQNKIHHIGRVCTDIVYGLAAIYTEGGSNITIDGNVIHDIGRFAAGENGCNPGNAYYKNHDHGFYIKGGSNIVVKNNVFYNHRAGWSLHAYPESISGLKLINNTFAFGNPYGGGHIALASPLSNSVIANNVFYEGNNIAIWSCCGVSLSNVQANNNIIYGGTIGASGLSGISFSGNLNNTDPKLVNPSGFDFHLQPNSPAISLGLTLAEVTTDHDGFARPQGGGFDIGAYEFLGGGSTLTPPTNLAVGP